MKRRTNLVLAAALVCFPAYVRGGDCDTTVPCPETDVNCDDVTDGFDIAVVRSPSNWLMTAGAAAEPRADVNGDGVVDGFDIAEIRSPLCWLMSGVGITRTELAGRFFSTYPFFEFVRAFNDNDAVLATIDPTRFPEIVDQTCDIYVVEDKTEAEWDADPSLIDVRSGGPGTHTFEGATIQDNTVILSLAALDSDAGTGLGVGYDVVFDCDQDGALSTADYIDGYSDEAGFYVVHDTTQAGPLAVTEVIYSGGSWLGQDTYYPTDIGALGQLPLVVISHGNGHDYQWYDQLGFHLASYGYVVMSHQNETDPGIETASSTTLTNTDYIIGNQATIAGGVLDGHIDSSRITWIGHSRGAEGITRAYDRIFDGTFLPANYDIDDIVLLSSMLPTDFLGTVQSNPHGANYHLWTASADADVSGIPSSDIAQTFHLHDRATGFRHSTVVQGAGHGDFHDGGGSSVACDTCPCLIGRPNTHLIQKGYFLPLIKHYVEGNIPATDFLWRQWERFKPIGAPIGACTVVNNTYRNGAPAGNFRIDDYQTNFATTLSSSGGAVTFTVENLTEDRLDDLDSTFAWIPSDPMNGFTYGRPSDSTRGVVFDWNGADRFYEIAIIASQQDFSDDKFLSFRAAQQTRHPATVAVLGDLTFTVTLRDGSGTTGSINIGAYGGGIEEPYQRRLEGVGVGWHGEFETIRIRLTDFLTNGSGLNLNDIRAVRFDFGPSSGSNEGRLGLDDIELTNDGMPT